MSRSAPEVAAAVSAVFSSVFDQLAEWRAPIEQVIAASPEVRPADLDAAVAELVLPRIVEPDPLLVGAGFIADGEIVRGRDVHFAWWLGPLEANPVLGSTTEPALQVGQLAAAWMHAEPCPGTPFRVLVGPAAPVSK